MKRSVKPLLKRLERYPAGRPIADLLPKVVKKIKTTQSKQYSQVGKIWAGLVGNTYAKMTSIEKFKDGILYIRVSSAPLYSMLCTQQRPRLIAEIRRELPSLGLINIVFRR